MAEYPLTREDAARLEGIIRANLEGQWCGCARGPFGWSRRCPSHAWTANEKLMGRLAFVCAQREHYRDGEFKE